MNLANPTGRRRTQKKQRTSSMRTPWYHLPNKMIPDEIETDMNLLHKKRKGESFLGKKKDAGRNKERKQVLFLPADAWKSFFFKMLRRSYFLWEFIFLIILLHMSVCIMQSLFLRNTDLSGHFFFKSFPERLGCFH